MSRLSGEQVKCLERLFWPFVLLVGRGICKEGIVEKGRFWRDHAIMSFLVIGPSALLEILTLKLNPLIYVVLLSLGSALYVRFMWKWRRYLARKPTSNL